MTRVFLGFSGVLTAAILFVAAAPAAVTAPPSGITLQTAAGYPMQYYVSLPHGWAKGKRWPVVVIIENATKEWQDITRVFADARGDRPFILVTPLILTNGGHDHRHMPVYHYPDSTWDRVDRVGTCAFDLDGVTAVMADVTRRYGGEDRCFLTGWEAGGHLVFATLFRHPERLRAVAPNAPNYIGRCMDDVKFSVAKERSDLPIRVFYGTADSAASAPNGVLRRQWLTVEALAKSHGYLRTSEAALPGRGHDAFAAEILAYFGSFLAP